MSAALAIRSVLVNELPVILKGEVRGSAKVVALRVGVTPRCIQGLRGGDHLARSDVLLALGRAYPAVRKKLDELMDAERGDGDSHPSLILDQIAKLVANR